ncbi:MAG: hypothetical protein HC828_22290 [Blastochloris sp.]|nr:hypothetical protein [Blastochloris sp.]
MTFAGSIRVPSGPRPLPMIGWRGNVLQFFHDPIDYMTRLAGEHGLVTTFTAGGNRNLVFPSPICGAVQ